MRASAEHLSSRLSCRLLRRVRDGGNLWAAVSVILRPYGRGANSKRYLPCSADLEKQN